MLIPLWTIVTTPKMPKDNQTALWPSGWTSKQLAAISKSNQGLLGQGPAGLDSALDRYLVLLRAAVTHNEFIDVRLGELLVGAIRRLLGSGASQDATEQTWIRMTIAYLLTTDDVANDLSAIDGLDDDANVVLGLLNAVSQPDLAKAIIAHLNR
jgi:hypothetical protein